MSDLQSGHAGALLSHYLQTLRPYMDGVVVPGTTEVCINKPGEIWTESFDGWNVHAAPMVTFDWCQQLARLIASHNGKNISEKLPILSGKLPSKERAQVVLPPACTAGHISFTIRKPSEFDFSLEELEEQGAFKEAQYVRKELSDADKQLLALKSEGKIVEFLRLAVRAKKNICVAGATGSGKTTIMKSLIDCIPRNERLITIEDVHELFMPNTPNKVHLFYNNDDDSKYTSRDALASCVRMKPDRILLAELRGAETLDYIDSLNTGHPGSITSVHANSTVDTFERIASLIKKSPEGKTLDVSYVRDLCHKNIDIVLFYDRRRLKEVYYEPIR